ncbi:nucleotide-binding alpha-beta plait domain-containing protein [Tanacetum coccineum]
MELSPMSSELPWTKVSNRKRQKNSTTPLPNNNHANKTSSHASRYNRGGRSWNKDFNRVIKDKVTTFFFTRFPDNWDEKALWNMFSKYGLVVDLFIASKKTKLGTRFGFVRFSKVANVMAFEQRLGGIFIGNTRIVVNIAKYDKDGKKIYKESTGEDQGKHQNSESEPCISRSKANGRSYKDVMVGKLRNIKNDKKRTSGSVMELQTNQEVVTNLKRCWIGKARNIDILRNIHILLKQDGLGACNIKYIGGLYFLCQWQSEEAAKECLEGNRVVLSNWLSNAEMWDENMDSPGRLVWLEIEGLPICVWDSVSARRIGSIFGSVLEIDSMDLDCSSMNLVGVLIHTYNMEEFCQLLPIKVNGRLQNIRIVEDRNRSTLLNFSKFMENNSRDKDYHNAFLDGSSVSDSGVSETVFGRNMGEVQEEDDPRDDGKNIGFDVSLSNGPPIFETAAENDRLSKVAQDSNSNMELPNYINEASGPSLVNKAQNQNPQNEPNCMDQDLDGVKKGVKTKGRRIKRKALVIGKCASLDSDYLRCSSSQSVSNNDLRMQIGRSLGLIFEDDQEVSSIGKDGST